MTARLPQQESMAGRPPPNLNLSFDRIFFAPDACGPAQFLQARFSRPERLKLLEINRAKFSTTINTDLLVLGKTVAPGQIPKPGNPDSRQKFNQQTMATSSAATVNFAAGMTGSEAADAAMKRPTDTSNTDGDNFVNSDSAHKANETLATKLSGQPVGKAADRPTGRLADKPAGEYAVKSAKKLVANANNNPMPCAKLAPAITQKARKTAQSLVAAKNDDKKTVSVAKKNTATAILEKGVKGNTYCQHDWRQLFLVMTYYPDVLEDMMKVPAFKKMVAQSGGKIPRDHEMKIKTDDPDVLHGVMDLPSFRKMAEESRLSSSYENPLKGPVCANPLCGKPGHTIAICPGPVHAEFGWMLGCFFCNQYDHYADDWYVLCLSNLNYLDNRGVDGLTHSIVR